MAGSYNDPVARVVLQGDVAVTASAWVPLTASGSTGVTTGTLPVVGRRQIRYCIKSNPGGALALQYVSRTMKPDGTYEYVTPTSSSLIKTSTVYPGNTTVVEPIGDAIQVFGRLVKKKGFTFNSIRVVVSEFA